MHTYVGHVIYEMSSGHVLGGVVPTEEEYERVEHDEVKELLQLIFKLVVSPPRERGLENFQENGEEDRYIIILDLPSPLMILYFYIDTETQLL